MLIKRDLPDFSKARRAPKPQASPHDEPRTGTEICLQCWAVWIAGDPDRDLGIAMRKGVSADTGQDIYEAQAQADTKIAMATDAMIASLATVHQWAIKRAHGVTTVWRFPNLVFADVLGDAMKELTCKLENNCCTAVLF